MLRNFLLPFFDPFFSYDHLLLLVFLSFTDGSQYERKKESRFGHKSSEKCWSERKRTKMRKELIWRPTSVKSNSEIPLRNQKTLLVCSGVSRKVNQSERAIEKQMNRKGKWSLIFYSYWMVKHKIAVSHSFGICYGYKSIRWGHCYWKHPQF